MFLVPLRADEFKSTGPVYVVCRSGNRSGQVVTWLAGQGIHTINVDGGTQSGSTRDTRSIPTPPPEGPASRDPPRDRDHRDPRAGRPLLHRGHRYDRGRRGPPARHRPGPGRAHGTRLAGQPRHRDPRPQRLRVRRPGPGRPVRCHLRGPQGPRLRLRRAHCRGRGLVQLRCHDLAGAAHPRAHTTPRVLHPEHRGHRPGGVHRRIAAVRQRGPPRPDRPGRNRGPGPRPMALGAQARDRRERISRGVPDPRLRIVLQRHGHRGRGVHDRPPRPRPTRPRCSTRTSSSPRCWPAWTPSPPTTSTWGPPTNRAPARST